MSEPQRGKVIVFHTEYGCDTGCCGHVVEWDGPGEPKATGNAFSFDHPWSEDALTFARHLVTDHYGPEHVADLDWENCVISND